jgi:hypothetical protein
VWPAARWQGAACICWAPPALVAIKRVAVGLDVLMDQPVSVAGIRPQTVIITQQQKNLSVLREFGPLLEHFKAVRGAAPFMKDPAIMQEKKLSLLNEMPRGNYVMFPFQRKDGMPAT